MIFFEIRFRAILDTGVISEKDGQGSGQAILILEFISEKDGQGSGQAILILEFISGKDGQGDYRVFPTASGMLISTASGIRKLGT